MAITGGRSDRRGTRGERRGGSRSRGATLGTGYGPGEVRRGDLSDVGGSSRGLHTGYMPGGAARDDGAAGIAENSAAGVLAADPVAEAQAPTLAAPRARLGALQSATALGEEEENGRRATVSVSPTVVEADPSSLVDPGSLTQATTRADFFGAEAASLLRGPQFYSRTIEEAGGPGASPLQTFVGIREGLGEGKIVGEQFQPERGRLGRLRDFLDPTDPERGIAPSLAGQAYRGEKLGELSESIRLGNVKTEEQGTRARKDPVGQLLNIVGFVSDLFGIPDPGDLASPVGAALSAVPLLGTATSIGEFISGQQRVAGLAEAGIIDPLPEGRRAPVQATGALQDQIIPVLGDTGSQAVAVAQADADTDPFSALRSRAARRGFTTTRRTGVFGITAPLAVRT